MASSLFKPVAPASRLTLTMSARLYACLCGFVPPSLASHKNHRKVCPEWRNRPDPRGLQIERRKTTLLTPGAVMHCEVCEKSVDHHSPSCPFSFSEQTRREAAVKAGLTSNEFYALLVALKKRYPGGWTGR